MIIFKFNDKNNNNYIKIKNFMKRKIKKILKIKKIINIYIK